jgi:hypothetical protein
MGQMVNCAGEKMWRQQARGSLLCLQTFVGGAYGSGDMSATTNDDLGRGTAKLTMMTTIGSTVDLIEMGGNPYGLTVATATTGLITMGDLIVCNFNDGATKSIPLIQLAQSIRRNPSP